MTKPITIFSIDPGPRESAWCEYDGQAVKAYGHMDNHIVAGLLVLALADRNGRVACEWIESMGMAVGKETFETCFWIGRFAEVCAQNGPDMTRISRREVKLHLCGSSRAKDANVRQAVIDRFAPTGGGRVPQIGTKTNPGPCYGVTSHVWQALAVGITWMDLYAQKELA